ncbi:MAG: anthranilate synthase component I [Acidobacteria bacterium]|nr:anthranilate synthase component I [Acidobacteriota bacterium]
MSLLSYVTPHGITVSRKASSVPFEGGLRDLPAVLDRHRGIYLSSGYEFPGRYSRWDIASSMPPLEIVGAGRIAEFRPLNQRGEVLCRMLDAVLHEHPHWESFGWEGGGLKGTLKGLSSLFPEEERSRQPSGFTILRALIEEFKNPEDSRLALIGAFGYDLLFQFDPIDLKLPRTGAKDFRLFLCDDIYFVDRKREVIERFEYEFSFGALSTDGHERGGERIPPPPATGTGDITSDHTPEEYMAKVRTLQEGMKRGDFYEVVIRQTFSAPYQGSAAELFQRVQKASPSPYEFLIQFGDEALVGASPEMFVRVEGSRVETCPISGTARRTGDPLRDADNIRELLGSAKEESELTMCTDVDRNDKSRVSIPGSVKVIGRRLIESYAGVFHTVDHVEGILEPQYDSLDAFLTHMWAVTVIGAPKKWAAQAIENLEKSARGWYGGAVGMISLSGDINTGILIRTVHLRNGIAGYPAGATILYDSIPENEELETRHKAAVFFRALHPQPEAAPRPSFEPGQSGKGLRMLLVDNEDCFIHTLANYARQTGAEVVTYRSGFPLELIGKVNPDLVLISPGPGRPSDFGVPDLVRWLAARRIPTFGVCLGLQGIVEAFGGELGVLDYPMHGKPSTVAHTGKGAFEGLPEQFKVGRYHSLYALPERLPAELEVTARSDDGVIMGVRHRELPIEAVQFHPESILTLEDDCGLRLIRNALAVLTQTVAAR